MGDLHIQSRLASLVELIAHLVCSCTTDTFADHGTPPTYIAGPVIALSRIDIHHLFNKVFLRILISDNVNSDATARIVRHWCWQNETYSQAFTDMICEEVSKNNYFNFKPYFVLLTSLLVELDDSLVERRVAHALPAFLKVIENNVQYPRATDHAIRYFVEIGNNSKRPEIKQWIFANQVQVNSVLAKANLKLK